MDSSAVEYIDKNGDSHSVKDVLDNGTGGTVDLSEYTKTFTSLDALGLTAPITVGEIFNAMSNKTMAILSCEDIADHITDVPIAYGVLTIKKSGVGRFSIDYQNSLFGSPCNVKRWIGTLKGSDGTGIYWKQLSAEPTFVTLNDIGLTADATFQDVVDILPKGGSALLGVTEFTNYQTIFPYEEGNDQFGRVYIVKGNADGSRMYARWFRKDGVKEAIAIFNINDNKFGGWRILKNQQTFTSLNALNLTADATVEDVVNALKNGESFLAPVNTFTNYETIFPNKVPNDQWNKIHIIKGTSLSSSHIRCYSQNGACEYLANVNNTNIVSWNDVSGAYTDISDSIIEKLGNEILKYPVGKYRINSTTTGNKFTDLPSDVEMKCGLIEINGTAVGKSPFTDTWVYRMYKFECLTGTTTYVRRLNSGATVGQIELDTGWQKLSKTVIIDKLADLGLTAPCTTAQIANALKGIKPQRDVAIAIIDCAPNEVTDAPSDYGLLRIETIGYDRLSVRFDGIGSSNYKGSWIGQIKGSGGTFSDITWSKIIGEDTITPLNTRIKDVENTVSSTQSSLNAQITSISNSTNSLSTKVNTLQSQYENLFQSVSDGKTLVANAITGKGVSTSTTATFATMATNIGKITNYTASEKQALATAITNKGVSTSSTDSFATMATNISKIPQTVTWKEETVSASPDANSHIAKFVFSNTVLGVRQLTAPGYHYRAETTETKMFIINSNYVEVYLDSGTWKMTAMVRNT